MICWQNLFETVGTNSSLVSESMRPKNIPRLATKLIYFFFLHLIDLFNVSLAQSNFSTNSVHLIPCLQRVYLLDVQSHMRIIARKLNDKCIRLLIFVKSFCQLQQSKGPPLSKL